MVCARMGWRGVECVVAMVAVLWLPACGAPRESQKNAAHPADPPVERAKRAEPVDGPPPVANVGPPPLPPGTTARDAPLPDVIDSPLPVEPRPAPTYNGKAWMGEGKASMPTASKGPSSRPTPGVVAPGASVPPRVTTPMTTATSRATPYRPPATDLAPPPPPPSIDAADVVATFVRERMRRASVAFVVPDQLARNEPGVALLRVAPASVPPRELEQELRLMLGRAGHGDAASISVAPRMVATLTSDQPCVIELRNPPADRAVAFGERTTWEWTVRPTRDTGAALELTVSLSAPVVVDGRETSYAVGVYRRRLDVQVTYRDMATDALAWLATSWATVAAFATSMGAVGTWMFRRRRRQPHRVGF